MHLMCDYHDSLQFKYAKFKLGVVHFMSRKLTSKLFDILFDCSNLNFWFYSRKATKLMSNTQTRHYAS